MSVVIEKSVSLTVWQRSVTFPAITVRLKRCMPMLPPDSVAVVAIVDIVNTHPSHVPSVLQANSYLWANGGAEFMSGVTFTRRVGRSV
mgnify:CR=1 FL=1